MITLKKEQQNNSKLKQEEFGADLSPDDLDVREDNDLTKEQKNNSQEEKFKENNSLHAKE